MISAEVPSTAVPRTISSDVDQQQQLHRVLGQRHQPGRHLRRDPLPGEVEAEGRGGADHQHHRAGVERGFLHHLRQVGDPQAPVGEHADQDRVEHRDRAGLGGREDAVADADDDEHRDRERPERVAERAAELGHAGELGAQRLVAAPPGDDPGDDHQRGGEQQAGHDAADEQAPDRDVGDVAVDDQADRGRDQRRDDRRARGDDGGEGRAVVRLHHLRAEDLREHRRVGRGRGGQAAEQGGEHGAHLRQRAGHVADQRVGQGQQPPGDAGLVHDRAGEHEERDRQQRIGVGGAHHLLHEDVERHLAVDQEERQRADGDRERDRRLEREQHQHQDAGDPVSPHWFPGRRRWPTAPRRSTCT